MITSTSTLPLLPTSRGPHNDGISHKHASTSLLLGPAVPQAYLCLHSCKSVSPYNQHLLHFDSIQAEKSYQATSSPEYTATKQVFPRKPWQNVGIKMTHRFLSHLEPQPTNIQTTEWRHMCTTTKLCSGFLPHSQLWPIISHPLNALSTSLPRSSFLRYLSRSHVCCCKTSVICYSQWHGLLSDRPCCCDKTGSTEGMSWTGADPATFNLSPSNSPTNK